MLKDQFQFIYTKEDADGTVFTAKRDEDNNSVFRVTWEGFDTYDRRGIFFPEQDVLVAFQEKAWELVEHD